MAEAVGRLVHFVALAVEQGDAERVEAHEPAHRLGHRVVDVLGGDGARAEGGHFVDHLEAKRPLVQPPDLLHGPTELAREARRDRVGGEPTAATGPEEDKLAEGAPGLPEGSAQQHGLAGAPSGRRVRHGLAPHTPRRLGQALAEPAVERRSPPRPRGHDEGRPAARPEHEPAARGARQRDELAQGAREPGLRRRRAAERGKQIGEEATDLHRRASSTSATTSKRPNDGMR